MYGQKDNANILLRNNSQYESFAEGLDYLALSRNEIGDEGAQLLAGCVAKDSCKLKALVVKNGVAWGFMALKKYAIVQISLEF